MLRRGIQRRLGPRSVGPARLALIVPAVIGGAALVAAHAQVLEQYDPTGIPGYESWIADAVLDRLRTEYDSLGVRAGSFLINPSLSESFGYNSNILGASPSVGSPVAETAGNVSTKSDWSRDSLELNLGFDDVRFLQQQNVSYTDWTAALGGSLDIGRDQAAAAYSHNTLTSLPSAIGTIGANQPITYNLDEARLSYTAHFGRISLVPAFDVALWRFDNGTFGGATAHETANDRNVFTGSLTAAYAFAPARSLVVVASGSSGEYTTKTPGTPTPGYTDVSLLAGIDYRTSGPFRYRALIGYDQRTYVSRQLSNISAPITELDVIWTPSQLTTLTGRVSRSIQSSLTTGTGGYTFTDGRLQVDHEYLRNVLLQGFGEVQRANYTQGQGTQTVLSAGASVTWLVNRRIRITGRYTFSQSTDTVNTSQNTNSNVGLVELGLRL